MSEQGAHQRPGHGPHHIAAGPSGLVTGDAVVVDLRLAKLPSRSLAFLIDLILQMIALVAAAFLVGVVGGLTDGAMATVFVLVTTVAILVGYPATMETLSRGRTVGKLALGVRTVRNDGGAIRFRHALVRALVAIVEIYICFGAIAVIASLISPEGRRVGDYLAGTVVVRERAPKSVAAQFVIPSSLQPWAATLDLHRLQAGTALSARQYLARAHSLKSQARASLGRSLANEMVSQVSPPPPVGVSPELFLAVVLAERGRRAEGSQTTPAAMPAWPSQQRVQPPVPPPAFDRADDAEPTGGFAAPS